MVVVVVVVEVVVTAVSNVPRIELRWLHLQLEFAQYRLRLRTVKAPILFI